MGKGQSQGFKLCDSDCVTSSDDTVVETEDTRGWPGSGRGGLGQPKGAAVARLWWLLHGRVGMTASTGPCAYMGTHMHGQTHMDTGAHTRLHGHTCSPTRKQVHWKGGGRPVPAGRPRHCPGFGGECELWGWLGDECIGRLHNFCNFPSLIISKQTFMVFK